MVREAAAYSDLIKDALVLGKEDLYQQLMRREENVLKTIDRVMNDVRADVYRKKRAGDAVSIMQAPLHETLRQFVHEWERMLRELARMQDPSELLRVFWEGRRKIYAGALLVFLCVLYLVATA